MYCERRCEKGRKEEGKRKERGWKGMVGEKNDEEREVRGKR